MKNPLFILFIAVFLIQTSVAQEDVIYLKDKTVLKGKVEEYTPDDNVKFKMTCCDLLTVKISSVDRIIINNTTDPMPSLDSLSANSTDNSQKKTVLTNTTQKSTLNSVASGSVCFKNMNKWPRKIEMISRETDEMYFITLQKAASSCLYDLPVGIYSYKAYSVNEMFNGRVVTAQSQIRIKADQTKNVMLIVDGRY